MNRRHFLKAGLAALTVLETGCTVAPPSAGGQRPWLSKKFEKARMVDPSLDELAGSVMIISAVTAENGKMSMITPLGSATLLDKKGTIIFDHHELSGLHTDQFELLAINPATGDFYKFRAKLDLPVYPGVDFAFATITNPDFSQIVAKSWIKPVTWSATNFGVGMEGQSLLLTGYPGPDLVFHVEKANMAQEFVGYGVADFGIYFCKQIANGRSFHGMSGAAVFKSEGKKFLGIISAVVNSWFSPIVTFSPSEAVFAEYRQRFPDRVAFANIEEIKNVRSIPQACMDPGLDVTKSIWGWSRTMPGAPAPR